ncbi:hypothetical protein ACFYSF_22875 [Streptomyces canus]|uniref:hypothetical protein n=1 Tax=Streptomyces canus TaxID=58343 RepID=UPI0036A3515C
MTETLLHVGTAGCIAACGALLLAARRCGRPEAEPARLHVSPVELVPCSPGTGGLEVVDFFGGTRADLLDDVAYRYCPEDLRVTHHTVLADGTRRCSDCNSTSGDS